MALTLFICFTTVFIAAEAGKSDTPKQSCDREIKPCCERARWVKLNNNPVCFGATQNQYGSFEAANKNLLVHKFKFVYRSGNTACARGRYGFFGCTFPTVVDHVGVFLTDAANNIIVPAAPIQHLNGQSYGKSWYRVHGFKNGATEVILSTGNSAFEIKSGQMLRFWYGEDLFNQADGDNSGRACTDVYGLV